MQVELRDREKEWREMLGFLLSLLIPIKIAAAAVLIYLFLKLAVAAETPNSQTTTLNQQVLWSRSFDAPGAPGVTWLDLVIHKKSEERVGMDYIWWYNDDK